MFVSFESISPSSRIWIYQSNRKLSSQDKTAIANYLSSFTERWAAHGQPLKTSFDIRYDQFIILAVDENHHSPSGCSIDESVHVMKEIEQPLGISFFDRNLVAFKKDDSVVLVALPDLKQKFAQGTWNEQTLTFNNLISIKGQLVTDWIVPAGNTWLKRYLPALKVAN